MSIIIQLSSTLMAIEITILEQQEMQINNFMASNSFMILKKLIKSIFLKININKLIREEWNKKEILHPQYSRDPNKILKAIWAKERDIILEIEMHKNLFIISPTILEIRILISFHTLLITNKDWYLTRIWKKFRPQEIEINI